MKLKTGSPRVRGPRRDAAAERPAALRAEPATFAWIEPLADVSPVVVERETITERNVDRPVFIDREVEKIVEVEKIIELHRPVEVEKIVERQIFIDREVEKVVEVEKIVEKPIIVGRGPSISTKISRIMPKPMPVLAGAASLLAVIAIMSLMSPSGENASAERASAMMARAGESAKTPSLTLDNSPGELRGKGRDPFAAKGYAPPRTAATGAAAKTKAEQVKTAKAAAATRAGAPAAVTTSMFTARLTSYSSYTPWQKVRKRAGGWLDFDGKPTVKVLSVGKSSSVLFVVTDVDVIKEKSAHISYNKPIRQVKLAKGGVVRFADYRNIQGDDVTYTIRYEGSEKIKLSAVTR